jgi:hypothetical protein
MAFAQWTFWESLRDIQTCLLCGPWHLTFQYYLCWESDMPVSKRSNSLEDSEQNKGYRPKVALLSGRIHGRRLDVPHQSHGVKPRRGQ